jgi:hypothetical protein
VKCALDRCKRQVGFEWRAEALQTDTPIPAPGNRSMSPMRRQSECCVNGVCARNAGFVSNKPRLSLTDGRHARTGVATRGDLLRNGSGGRRRTLTADGSVPWALSLWMAP